MAGDSDAMALASPLSVVCGFWRELDLEGMRTKLDETGLKVAEHQEESLQNRRKLAESTRDFRRNNEAVSKTVGPLLKQYQEEIDRLTKRAKHGETAFLDVYQKLYEAPDPAPALALAFEHASRATDLEAQCKKLATELAEYKAESSQIRNQDVTVRKLEEKVRSLEAHVEEQDKELQEAFSAAAHARASEPASTSGRGDSAAGSSGSSSGGPAKGGSGGKKKGDGAAAAAAGAPSPAQRSAAAAAAAAASSHYAPSRLTLLSRNLLQRELMLKLQPRSLASLPRLLSVEASILASDTHLERDVVDKSELLLHWLALEVLTGRPAAFHAPANRHVAARAAGVSVRLDARADADAAYSFLEKLIHVILPNQVGFEGIPPPSLVPAPKLEPGAAAAAARAAAADQRPAPRRLHASEFRVANLLCYPDFEQSFALYEPLRGMRVRLEVEGASAADCAALLGGLWGWRGWMVNGMRDRLAALEREKLALVAKLQHDPPAGGPEWGPGGHLGAGGGRGLHSYGSSGGGGAVAAATASIEETLRAELGSQRELASRLRSELASVRSESEEAREVLETRVEGLKAALAATEQHAAALEEELAARPTQSQGGGGRGGLGAAGSLEALLLSKNRHLEHELTMMKLKVVDVRQEADGAAASAAELEVQLAEQVALVRQLEEDLLASRGADQRLGGGGGLACENDALKGELYVHSRTGPSGKSGDVEVGAEVERRYGRMYDEGINPFKEFKDQQKERQKSSMGLVDKAMYMLSQLVYGNSAARLFAFVYLALMHALVFASLMRMTHHSSNQLYAHTQAVLDNRHDTTAAMHHEVGLGNALQGQLP
ncbi:Protein CASP [Tetrabaena socialis]|uniref:Protein CASP n=1 Tax=Tetrabaena socialis TaxID=47790 RepID=A0A2J7ZVA1_9CHLO|nr:Protein CASP [Tetrabaena socialis]|eukprot:PNH04179.1 Protein CASP [Tetrabaena socialis]